uniref:Protochlorophyllide reductase n=1 Tax=Tetraselmis chuii TaxID=63592 RepID=A0A7S1XBL0_9CHLO|mmetsp:Transcript_8901/g.16016  ORF Transcript_8901/g.16016 Transcript_8901/m.16016 type:complete len:357 (+) Transcript_8901:101-1171(+)
MAISGSSSCLATTARASGRRKRAGVASSPRQRSGGARLRVMAYGLDTALNGADAFETCEAVADRLGQRALVGKRVLITGATSGIGKQTAQTLAALGADVLITSRIASQAEECARELGVQAVPQDLDLSSQASVRAFVAEAGADVGALDVVIANAGVGFVPGKLKTAQGLDLAFGVNHLGHFTLLQGLMSSVMAAPPGRRIVVVASEAHRSIEGEFGLGELEALEGMEHRIKSYAYSKLCNLLYAAELRRRLSSDNVGVYAFCPGVADTGLKRYLPQTDENRALFDKMYSKESNPAAKTINEAAATAVHLAGAPLDELGDRLYWTNCRPLEPSASALDEGLAKQLWELSEQWQANAH